MLTRVVWEICRYYIKLNYWGNNLRLKLIKIFPKLLNLNLFLEINHANYFQKFDFKKRKQ